MNRIKTGGKVFRDPVHQLIRIAPDDEYILELIDTPEFQRLRRIRQLGVSWLTYHGAEHSRFSHSLGVFNFAQRIIQSLQQKYGRASEIATSLGEHERVLKAAALLHDVGHAPFSHMLEKVSGGMHHEARTVDIILDEQSQIHKVLKGHELNPKDVASVIRKDFPVKLVVDIVSSQLDADRMDYLLRDSLHTGVGYGEYDSEWLLHALCAGRLSNDPKSPKFKLCLDRSRGLHAAERFILARLHMYQQVYMHRATRGFEVMLRNLFKAAAHCATDGHTLPDDTPPLIVRYFSSGGKLNHADFLQFDESQMIAALHVWAVAEDQRYATIQMLSQSFLNRQRLYVAVDIDGKPETMLKLGQAVMSLPKEADGCTDIYGLDTIEDTPYKGMLYQVGKSATDSDADEDIINNSILLADSGSVDRALPVESVSHMLKALDAEKFQTSRLYFNRNRRDDIAKTLGSVLPSLKELKN